jgi:hypothetical protein
MKRSLLLIFTILLSFVLVACGGDEEETEAVEESENTEEQGMPQVEFSDDEMIEGDITVLNVNGTEITGDKYNNIYRQLKTMYHMNGADTSDLDALQNETIDILTEQELILQDALENGIEVTEEDAQEEIDLIVETNGEEAIDMMLEEYELTEEQFREQLMDDLVTIQYIETFDVEVTDEEIEEQYNLLKEESDEVGELEEYEDLIRQALIENKQSEMLASRVDELREEAEIETLI